MLLLSTIEYFERQRIQPSGELIPLGRIYDTNNNKQLTYKGSDGYWREYTYNSNNNELTYKDSTGYWTERTYDSNINKQLTYKGSDGYWGERTYDSNNNQLTYKDSNGYWNKSTYDSNNNLLTSKDSTGYWTERTYDSNNNELTSKDSTGVDKIVLIKGVNHTLWYAIDSNKYVAGCAELSYKECIEFYEEFKDEHEDAELFLETIKKHNLTLS